MIFERGDFFIFKNTVSTLQFLTYKALTLVSQLFFRRAAYSLINAPAVYSLYFSLAGMRID